MSGARTITLTAESTAIVLAALEARKAQYVAYVDRLRKSRPDADPDVTHFARKAAAVQALIESIEFEVLL